MVAAPGVFLLRSDPVIFLEGWMRFNSTRIRNTGENAIFVSHMSTTYIIFSSSLLSTSKMVLLIKTLTGPYKRINYFMSITS